MSETRIWIMAMPFPTVLFRHLYRRLFYSSKSLWYLTVFSNTTTPPVVVGVRLIFLEEVVGVWGQGNHRKILILMLEFHSKKLRILMTFFAFLMEGSNFKTFEGRDYYVVFAFVIRIGSKNVSFFEFFCSGKLYIKNSISRFFF